MSTCQQFRVVRRAALTLIILAVAGCDFGGKEWPARLSYDLRGNTLPPEFQLSGDVKPEYVHPESEGLRITLPKERDDLDAVRLDMPTAVQGNCEITATIDIVEAEEPPNGIGVGVFLAANQAARVGRMTGAGGEQAVVWEQWRRPDGSREYHGQPTPCLDKVRRLRLKRIGTTMHFLWSPDAEGPKFREVGQCEFTSDAITLVRLIAQTGQQRCRLDVRLIDLKIADGIIETETRRPWLPAVYGVGAASVVLLVLLAIRRWARKPLAA